MEDDTSRSTLGAAVVPMAEAGWLAGHIPGHPEGDRAVVEAHGEREMPASPGSGSRNRRSGPGSGRIAAEALWGTAVIGRRDDRGRRGHRRQDRGGARWDRANPETGTPRPDRRSPSDTSTMSGSVGKRLWPLAGDTSWAPTVATANKRTGSATATTIATRPRATRGGCTDAGPSRPTRVRRRLLPTTSRLDKPMATAATSGSEQAGRGQRQGRHVVTHRPAEVLQDDGVGGGRHADGSRDALKVVADQRHVARRDGCSRATADGAPHVRRSQGRRIVDAVADHDHAADGPGAQTRRSAASFSSGLNPPCATSIPSSRATVPTASAPSPLKMAVRNPNSCNRPMTLDASWRSGVDTASTPMAQSSTSTTTTASPRPAVSLRCRGQIDRERTVVGADDHDGAVSDPSGHPGCRG